MLYVCVNGVMDVVFSVGIVTRGAVGTPIWEVCVFCHADVACLEWATIWKRHTTEPIS